MLPVAVLPICGILMGVGYLMCPASMQGQEVSGVVAVIGYFLVKAGGAIIDNMTWLFVIGVSVGMSDDGNGASALAGLVCFLIITSLLSPAFLTVAVPSLVADEIRQMAFAKIQNPFIGIMAGIIGAGCYNRFKNVKLPQSLSFFSGRRFVIIITALISLLATAVLAIIWPLAFGALTMLGKWILGLGGIGVGIYTFLNRLLIPLGLHHALNNVFWFDTIGIGDLTAFWSGKTSEQVGWSLGMYMSGFFPSMMFGIPGAALAMIQNAKNRKQAVGILLSSSVCAFVCGVTEPFEFSFMFLAFPLYVVYSLLYGIFAAVTYYSGFRAGFSFSAGATDLLFSSTLPAAAKTYMIMPLGIAAFAVFYLVFTVLIRKLHFTTPGNENDVMSTETFEKASDMREKSGGNQDRVNSVNEYDDFARALLAALGGRKNLTNIDCCATRLRLGIKNTRIIDHAAIKRSGAIASKTIGDNACQIIIGVTVQQVCEALKNVQEGEKIKRGQVLDFGNNNYKEETDGFLSGDDFFETSIKDEKGIHARPAAALAATAKKYNSEIIMKCNNRSASLKSITEIMSLGAVYGSKVRIEAKGDDFREALKDIKSMFK